MKKLYFGSNLKMYKGIQETEKYLKKLEENTKNINREEMELFKHGIRPLLCIGETAEEKKYGISGEILRQQLKIGFYEIDPEECKNIWVAYEPVWSIGVNGIPATAEYAQKMHMEIKKALREIFGDNAEQIPVLYGGSVNPENADQLILQPAIDGLFVGRAAWDADAFDKLIRHSIHTYKQNNI